MLHKPRQALLVSPTSLRNSLRSQYVHWGIVDGKPTKERTAFLLVGMNDCLKYNNFLLTEIEIYLPFLYCFPAISSRIYCCTKYINNVELQITIPNHILVLSEWKRPEYSNTRSCMHSGKCLAMFTRFVGKGSVCHFG